MSAAAAIAPRSAEDWRGYLRANPEVARRLESVIQPRMTRYIPHAPFPQQAAFLLLPHREVLYGGAAGGGKSNALLMAALQYVDVPGYRALLLRRTFADLALPGALMDRAEAWLRGTDAKWNERDKTWTFPSGATLSFGYLEAEKDKYRYQGAEFQFIGFDELTQFTQTQYTYLFSRLRRLEGVLVPLRMRAASNPGGVGHEWVYQRFFVEGRAKGRVFISARLDDNPHLDQEEYRESLAELDPITRRQLEHGDWAAKHEGDVFRRDWFRIIEPDDVPREVHRAAPMRFWDFAATEKTTGNDPDFTAGAKGVLVGGDLYILDVRRFRAAPEEVERRVRQTADEDGRQVMVHLEQEPGASGKITISHYERNVLDGYIVAADRPTGPKRERWKPFVSLAARGKVYLVRGPWVTAFLDEAESVPWVEDSTHDDQIDAASGLYSKLMAGDAGWLAAMVKR